MSNNQPADPVLALRQYGDELVSLFRQLVEVGGRPRDLFNRPLAVFEFDEPALDGFPVYKPSTGYQELCAALRKEIADRRRQGGAGHDHAG